MLDLMEGVQDEVSRLIDVVSMIRGCIPNSGVSLMLYDDLITEGEEAIRTGDFNDLSLILPRLISTRQPNS